MATPAYLLCHEPVDLERTSVDGADGSPIAEWVNEEGQEVAASACQLTHIVPHDRPFVFGSNHKKVEI